MEAYEKDFCLFWCTDTRVATAIGTRNVKVGAPEVSLYNFVHIQVVFVTKYFKYFQKLFPKQINVCCEGYVTDDEIVGNG